ncbi:1-acyl-sn-glycerol-3-phosphate acyltransferase alpha-like [Rhineura floridana]|uniref:1-acyl-sn-glycerol-3-phosphate acyltransferase alpha-like n=1 Tax=Rhineura floridana TaxID=261503 RepID=UPI002AC8671B|nr:1-acyl-sn-glycerol-3-phosphate acyltransferase alpha-like [Rhineura floridana]
MVQSLGLVNFFLFIFAVLLLYHYSSTFRYYFKVCFLNIWIFVVCGMVLPVLAARGRNVANMKVLAFVMKPVKYFLGIKIKVQGAQNLHLEGPYVILANHQCSVDVLGMLQILPERCILIVKKELIHYLTVGIAGWLSGFIFIDRKERAASIHAMAKAADTIVRDNLRIWVFPEGTRNYDGITLLPFKRGPFHLAVQAQVPVIPVVMSSYQNFFSKKNKRFTTGEVTIRILPPIKTEGLSPADVPELVDCVRKIMLSTFYEISTGNQERIPKEDTSRTTNHQGS